MIYIASPYSHDNPQVRMDRFIAAVNYAAKLKKEGRLCFCPIGYGRLYEIEYQLPFDFQYWGEFNRRMIRACDELHVLKLDGWEDSAGVEAEVAFARANDIPVEFVNG